MDFGSRHRVKAEFSLASLTDVVFLLLIFFMLTSSFVAPTAVRLLLPRAEGQVITPQHFRVAITPNGEIYWEGNRVADIQELEQHMRTALQEYQQANPEKARQEPPVVVVRADQQVTVQQLVDVLDAGRRVGVRMILATQPGKRERSP